jgi:hypothetical protein
MAYTRDTGTASTGRGSGATASEIVSDCDAVDVVADAAASAMRSQGAESHSGARSAADPDPVGAEALCKGENGAGSLLGADTQLAASRMNTVSRAGRVHVAIDKNTKAIPPPADIESRIWEQHSHVNGPQMFFAFVANADDGAARERLVRWAWCPESRREYGARHIFRASWKTSWPRAACPRPPSPRW